MATDAADGDHEASADSTVRIEDQVFYSGLVPGAAYAVKGKLVDKATGEDLLVGGSAVEGEAQFSPSSANGFETVSFEFDGTALRARTSSSTSTSIARASSSASTRTSATLTRPSA